MPIARPLDPNLCSHLVSLPRWGRNVSKEPDGCWQWMGDRFSTGYGRVGIRGKQYLVHRVAWVAANECDVAADMTVDHLCRQRRCVNVQHMEVVSRGENAARGSRRLMCSRGHDRPPGSPCPVCQIAHSIDQRTRIRAAAQAEGLSWTEYVTRYGYGYKHLPSH